MLTPLVANPRCLVERGRQVAHVEHERRDDRAVAGGRLVGLAGEHHEPGRVVVLVLDVVAQHGQAVDVGGQRGRDRGHGDVCELGDLAGGAGRVAGDHRDQPELTDHLAALAERVHVAAHGVDGVQGSCRRPPSARTGCAGSARPICSPEFLVLVPKPTIPNSYLYALLTTDQRFYDQLLARVTGTTGSRQRVKPNEVVTCRVVVPDAVTLADWDQFARPIYNQALSLLAEARILAALRDVLLPKLISGEIRVAA